MLQIKTFTIGDPNEDGDMVAECSATVTNSSSQIIDQIRYTAAFLNFSGGPAGFPMTFPKDCTLSPGESFEVSAAGHLNSAASAGGRDDIKLISNVRLLAKRVCNLGQLKSPTLAQPISSLVSIANETDLISDIYLSAAIVEYGDPEKCDLHYRVLVKSKSLKTYEEAEIEFVTFSDSDEELFRDTVRSTIASQGLGMFECKLYGMSKNELTQGYITVTLCVFDDIEGFDAQANSVPED